MSAVPPNSGCCGCKTVGAETLLFRAPGGRSIVNVHSSESSSVHMSVRWWCDLCHQSEWLCLDTGFGRVCSNVIGVNDVEVDMTEPPPGFFPFQK